jgi:hypothetical protein
VHPALSPDNFFLFDWNSPRRERWKREVSVWGIMDFRRGVEADSFKINITLHIVLGGSYRHASAANTIRVDGNCLKIHKGHALSTVVPSLHLIKL